MLFCVFVYWVYIMSWLLTRLSSLSVNGGYLDCRFIANINRVHFMSCHVEVDIKFIE